MTRLANEFVAACREFTKIDGRCCVRAGAVKRVIRFRLASGPHAALSGRALDLICGNLLKMLPKSRYQTHSAQHSTLVERQHKELPHGTASRNCNFAAHMHLLGWGIINLGRDKRQSAICILDSPLTDARLEDPVIGSFLSP